MNQPDSVKVKGRDIVPHLYGVWSAFEGCEPFINDICHMRWSEDGAYLWLGLESHNSMKVRPDEELELILLKPDGFLKQRVEEWTLPPNPNDVFYRRLGELLE